jgi:Uma2 family endonuclease
METMVLPPRTGMEAYELMPEGTLCQLINDVLIMSPAATPNHQRYSKKIFKAIEKYVEEKELGEVLYSPIDVYLNNQNVYQPDIVFVSNERSNIINWGKGIIGAPDLIIEILSKGNRKYDLKDKKDVYEQSGVKEYWVVDPETKWCEGFVLTGNKFQSSGEKTGQLCLRIIDLQISL